MIDADLDKKVRAKQAQMIREESRSVSFSAVINLALRGKIKI